MRGAARKFDFKQAAALRDQLQELRRRSLVQNS
jgi:excinuclease UvrABC helicase subunit UvrB